MQCCINDVNGFRLLLLNTVLFKFEIQNMVKFYVYISPIFSCGVTYVTGFDKTRLPRTRTELQFIV